MRPTSRVGDGRIWRSRSKSRPQRCRGAWRCDRPPWTSCSPRHRGNAPPPAQWLCRRKRVRPSSPSRGADWRQRWSAGGGCPRGAGRAGQGPGLRRGIGLTRGVRSAKSLPSGATTTMISTPVSAATIALLPSRVAPHAPTPPRLPCGPCCAGAGRNPGAAGLLRRQARRDRCSAGAEPPLDDVVHWRPQEVAPRMMCCEALARPAQAFARTRVIHTDPERSWLWLLRARPGAARGRRHGCLAAEWTNHVSHARSARRLRRLFAGFTLITPGFNHFKTRQWEALIESVDTGDQRSGYLGPPLVGHGQQPLMRAAIVERHSLPRRGACLS